MTKCYICDKQHKASDMKCCACNTVHTHKDHLYVDGCSSCMGKVEWCSQCDKDGLEKVECQHESEDDGDLGKYPMAKCLKCGEFYR